jgi:hypothetical protein
VSVVLQQLPSKLVDEGYAVRLRQGVYALAAAKNG